MPRRDIPLAKGEYYHIFNRGVARQPTYFGYKDYQRFVISLDYYRYHDTPVKLSRLLHIPEVDRLEILNKLQKTNNVSVEIISYCLMPNHFHILLKQISEDGISRFVRHLTDSYTKYINTKYERIGPLYQGQFKAVHISTDELLIHISRYIHLNPLVSYVVKEQDFLTYSWSSLHSYVTEHRDFVTPDPVLNHFPSKKHYLDFVMDQVTYGKELQIIKHLTLE